MAQNTKAAFIGDLIIKFPVSGLGLGSPESWEEFLTCAGPKVAALFRSLGGMSGLFRNCHTYTPKRKRLSRHETVLGFRPIVGSFSSSIWWSRLHRGSGWISGQAEPRTEFPQTAIA